MGVRSTSLFDLARSPGGRKLMRYSMVSAVSVAVGLTVLTVTYGLRLWSAAVCNIVACIAGGIPSYYLNRRWAWGKSGRSHLWKEVVPFWALAFLGLAFSTVAVAFAENNADRITSSHLVRTLIVMGANVGAFGVLWVGKFFIFNKLMFVHRLEELPEALDGRTGLPT